LERAFLQLMHSLAAALRTATAFTSRLTLARSILRESDRLEIHQYDTTQQYFHFPDLERGL
jgi:hypothetical protein